MRSRRFWAAGAVVGVLALMLALVAGFAASSHTNAYKGILLAKRLGNEQEKFGSGNEGPASTWEAEQAALEAYPSTPDALPFSLTANAQNGYTKLSKKGGKDKNAWQQIGPTNEAQYPGVLDQFLGGGHAYDASGRVQALAIAPQCQNKNKCRLYLAAAGGGVWTTDKLNGDNAQWQYASASFGTNAIGSLLVDPSDPSGNTVYAGTGEPNASVDSEAGVGVYKSTDAGQTWSLVPGSDAFKGRAISSMTFDASHNLVVGVARAIRGLTRTDGGATSNPPGGATFGVYRQTGSSFTLIWNAAAAGSVRGVNEVGVDPSTATTLYAAAFNKGVWRSQDNGTTWTQIKASDTPFNTDRATFATNVLPSGKTRMYVGEGNQGVTAAQVYRTDDANGAAAFTNITNSVDSDYCHSQCWYDNLVYTPAGSPDVLYLGGSFDYNNVNGPDNGLALMLSTDAGATTTDETRDKDNNGWTHPDQHAMVTVPGSPLEWIEGNDGGVVHSNGKFADASGSCASRGLSSGALAFCQAVLSRVPDQLTVMNKGLPTLQFQSLSVDPNHPTNRLMGGTQDNGTFQYNGSSEVWPQIIYGDGGQSGFNAVDGHLRFNTFTGEANDVNFRDGDPTAWVIASANIFDSPEGSLFYPPIIPDPNAATAGSIFEGAQSVWRTQDWAGNQAYLEANCPEFTTFAGQPGCGDFVQIGSPSDLTSSAYGDRAGGNVIAIARAPQNTGTMYVATTTGRVFVTDNANDPAASVIWTRLDTSATNDPGRVPTGLSVDPTNANRVYISYSGYSAVTPATPGHVFRIDRVGAVATWTDLSYDLPDFPATDVALDSVTGDLYASTDFGVMVLPNAATSWSLAAPGMPMVEVPALTIVPGSRLLYAASHGLGAWELNLPGGNNH